MTSLDIPDMSCGHCRAAVEKTIRAIDPEARMEFDMAARRVALRSSAAIATIADALALAGYPATTA